MLSKLKLGAATLVLAGGLFGANLAVSAFGADEPHKVPAPALDAPAAKAPEVAVLAGGCFWGVQGVFQHVKGVNNAVSGYDGGAKATAHYEMTSEGDTGHAESVQITFDPAKITYGKILQIYFSVAHDPTELNRQGPDSGTQYRSAIFPAERGTGQSRKGLYRPARRVPRVQQPDRDNDRARQDFLSAPKVTTRIFWRKNPTYPYIVYNDLPKVAALKALFPEDFRADPVLVGGGS